MKEQLELISKQRDYAYADALKLYSGYVKDGFKDDYGSYECGVLVIRHNKKTKSFCKEWWKEIMKSGRDQISFPYLLSKHKIKLKANKGDVRKHKWFKFQ